MKKVLKYLESKPISQNKKEFEIFNEISRHCDLHNIDSCKKDAILQLIKAYKDDSSLITQISQINANK